MSLTSLCRSLVALLVAVVASATVLVVPVAAHVTVSPSEAPAGGYGTIYFSVPHGCGPEPTEALIVQLPETLQSVTAEAVPGWDVTYTTAELDEPYDNHGQTVTEYISEIEWRAQGAPLPTDQFLTFGVTARWPDLPGATILLPAIQECPDGGEATWIDPAADADGPAPRVTLIAAGDQPVRGSSGDAAAPTGGGGTDGGETNAVAIIALVIAVAALGVAGFSVVSARRSTG